MFWGKEKRMTVSLEEIGQGWPANQTGQLLSMPSSLALGMLRTVLHFQSLYCLLPTGPSP